MSFKIDKQSLEELNITGRFRKGSVFNLFNKMKTIGGSRLLESIFQTPFNEKRLIDERLGIIQDFSRHPLYFEFDVSRFDLMIEYLDTHTPSNKLWAFATIVYKKILSALARDPGYKIIISGLHATITILHQAKLLLDQFPVHDHAFATKAQKFREMYDSADLQKLVNVDIYGTQSLQQVSFNDHLLKVTFRTEMQHLIEFIHQVDLYHTVSRITIENNFNLPVTTDKDNVLKIENLKHPSIENAVGNNLHFTEDQNVLFLTGANMAGKSTLMKTLGIGIYLAHIGFPVPADFFEFSVKDGMFTSINVADNVSLGYSHFYAEVMRVKQAAIAAATGDKLILIFDELFKGTNVKDAYDGTLAVTEAFATYFQSIFLVSTHILEVGQALEKKANIQFQFMPTELKDSIPHYTYKLEHGVTQDRQGMTIIQNEKILELIEPQFLETDDL